MCLDTASIMNGTQGAIPNKAALRYKCSKCRGLVRRHPHSYGPQYTLPSKGTVTDETTPHLM